MGNVSHERFLFLGSVSPGAFVEDRQDGTQVGHIDYTWCINIDEVRIYRVKRILLLMRVKILVMVYCAFFFFFFFASRQQIEAVYDDVKVVDVLDSKDQTHLALMSRPELGVTFTKLHCWTFTNYKKCVFLDADTLVSDNF